MCKKGQGCCCTCHSTFSIEQRFISKNGKLSKLLSATRKIVEMHKIPFFDKVSPCSEAVEKFCEGASPHMRESTGTTSQKCKKEESRKFVGRYCRPKEKKRKEKKRREIKS